ncbi:hypothetical protein CKM354_000775200 [Cercospora kikuchii]|uniref:Uncharacterized protein n=1 Tax=Cercospora kikuchii TaxID=84275 RepID=A0A9P3CNC4_9PEZI|nr:uncharacterized protein CKM354_000775200 [Cercospora kikuchii]GIZ44557.1 hypothetical protein CKM354_000775200 [Cercospora kikuchii]
MNTSCDPSPYFSLILPNTTASRVCGLTTTNNTALESCCEGGGPVSEYQCKKYCSTNLEINEFVDCLAKDHNASALIGLGPFCQDGIKSNNTNSLSGDQRSAASGRLVKTKSILWLLLLSFTAFANSETIPSLSTTKNLTPRQEQSSSSCSIDLHANYTTIRNSRKISADMECSDDTYCTQNFAVETDILQNNRTINGTSAAETQYDEFFEMLQTRTDRQFPALSSVQLSYDFLVGPGSFWVDFTPHAWCVNGTVSDCAGVGESDDPTPVTACGPLFVSDYETSANAGDASTQTIQGILNVVVCTELAVTSGEYRD